MLPHAPSDRIVLTSTDQNEFSAKTEKSIGIATFEPSDNCFNSVFKFIDLLSGEKSARLYLSTTNLARPEEMDSGDVDVSGGNCVM